MWVPAHDVYVTAGDPPVPFEDHRKDLRAWKGQRILDGVREGPEEGYAEFAARWADMGDPKNPHPSHVVGVTWDSAIPKFGIDRHGGVVADLGNPDKFSLSLNLAGWTWKGQRLEDGLPVLTTIFEKEGVRLALEEFADPLDGPRRERRGDLAMVLLEQWYPTDVDTGALHLLRLKALDPKGTLADFLLHDHEDNLFLKGWGMANEPVYDPQAAAYLFRDDAKAAVRAFYSMTACAFSHSTLEPVEHRWGWGQYFGPPSTDGAWFELYRRMLIHELDDGALLLGQAVPRVWLEDGRTIEVARAPTWFGKLTFSIASEAKAGRIRAAVRMPPEGRPGALLVRLRHPQAAAMRSVRVNGAEWKDFDPAREWVRISSPEPGKAYEIAASY